MATSPAPRNGKPKARSWFWWLRHRALITGEAMLLVGALQQLLSQHLNAIPMANAARVLLTMAMVLGVIGGVFVLARLVAAKGMTHTHDLARALPIPAANAIAHLAAFFGIFCLYAWIWHLPVQIPLLGTVGAPVR